MLRKVLLLHTLLLSYGLASVTIPTNQLFKNTLKRWGIRPLSDQDRIERWTRFVQAKAAVEQTTSSVILESLNRFTVLNNEEFEHRVKPLFQGYNITETLGDIAPWSPKTRVENDNRRKRSLPTTYDYWEKDVGLSTPRNHLTCNSAWSFPNVGAIEALNKHLTGDDTEFSEQYFMDCTFKMSGCASGQVNEGYKLTMMRQYLMSAEDWPYTAQYQECKFTDDIANFRNNAMNKIWVQSWVSLGKDENSMLEGLQISPVAFSTFVSSSIVSYSGGEYSDPQCAQEQRSQTMLLVGYTETILRVKASYGADFGDNGYINYKRGDENLLNCRFYQAAYSLAATYRRDVEYEYCSNRQLVTYQQCKQSCVAMNTESKSGWVLATVPTKYHNQLVVDKVTTDYPGVRGDDKFNYLWFGLMDEDMDENFEWSDSFTPVNYFNISDTAMGKKFGMINKDTGEWITKNSVTYIARGLCSRAINCWNIENAIKNGAVTFSKADLTEGTTATVKCNQGQPVGADILHCSAGEWDQPLPSCTTAEVLTCTGLKMTWKNMVADKKFPVAAGTVLVLSCKEGYQLRGDDEVTCSKDIDFSYSTEPRCDNEDDDEGKDGDEGKDADDDCEININCKHSRAFVNSITAALVVGLLASIYF